MQKKNIKKYTKTLNDILLYIYCICCIVFYSCNRKPVSNDRINLIIDNIKSTIHDKRFELDSITFLYTVDSVFMYKYLPTRYFQTSFYSHKDNVYEYRDIYDDLGGKYLGKDSILTFSIKDTSFVYYSTIEFISTTIDYPYSDCRYEIKKIDDNSYVTTKQSLIDTTYQEIYYYDKNFRIFKFINSYRENICVYTSK